MTREARRARRRQQSGPAPERHALLVDDSAIATLFLQKSLQPFGLLASFGNASGPVAPFAPGILGAKGSLYVTRQTLFTHIATREATQQMADDLFAVVGSGAVKIRIDQRYALADVAQAHRDLEARKTTGCTILTL